jgi:hypothetical protein
MNTMAQSKRDRVFPITLHNYCRLGQRGGTAEEVKTWHDLGITVGRTPNFDPAKHDKQLVIDILDACADHGMKCFVVDDRAGYGHHMGKTEKQVREMVAAVLKDFDGHPALYGLDAGDEPSQDRIGTAFRTAKVHFELAPHLTPFMSFGGYTPTGTAWMGLRSYRRYLDEFVEIANPTLLFENNGGLISTEPNGMDSYYRGHKMYVDASARHGGLPIWSTLCCTGHLTGLCPSEDNLRLQVNSAAMLGIKGIAWFLVYLQTPHWNYRQAPIDEHWERTETFHHLSRVLRTFNRMHGGTMLQLGYQRSFFVGQSFGGFPYTIDSELVKDATSDVPLVISEFVDDEGRDYVGVLCNSQTEPCQAVITWHGQPEVYRIGWEGKEEPAADYVDDANPTNPAKMTGPWLAPGQMELYRVVSDAIERYP